MERRYLIWSLEHKGWWRSDHRGYTSYRELAGKYSLAEATEIVDAANRHIIWSHHPDAKTPEPYEAIVPE